MCLIALGLYTIHIDTCNERIQFQCSAYIVISVHKSHLNRASNSPTNKTLQLFSILIFLKQNRSIFQKVACIVCEIIEKRLQFTLELNEYELKLELKSCNTVVSGVRLKIKRMKYINSNDSSGA